MKNFVPAALDPLPVELEALTALPCGCVASDCRAQTLDVQIVSIEVKGPHCHIELHATQGVLGMGETGELDTRQLDDLVVPQLAA